MDVSSTPLINTDRLKHIGNDLQVIFVNKRLIIVFLVLGIILGTLAIAGCQTPNALVSSSPSPGNAVQTQANELSQQPSTPSTTHNPSNYSNYQNRGKPGNFSNMTDTQRQDMMNQRQIAVTACQDKNENDSCVINNSRFNMTGSCRSMNSTLICTGSMPNRRGNRP